VGGALAVLGARLFFRSYFAHLDQKVDRLKGVAELHNVSLELLSLLEEVRDEVDRRLDTEREVGVREVLQAALGLLEGAADTRLDDTRE